MKAIMISIQSPHACNILNLIKLWEIRKKFPKDYVGWVYIYCTKDNELLCQIDNEWNTIKVVRGAKLKSIYNGKVVARFWCDKVEEYVNGCLWKNEDNDFTDYKAILKPSCLTEDELYDYCEDLSFKAIHITKLEIFDKPKEISEFRVYCYTHHFGIDIKIPLTRAPQSWQYIEV